MPNVYKTGLLQIRARFTNEADGDHTENVTFWEGGISGPYTLAQLQAIQAVFDAQWSNSWKAIGAANANYIGSVITDWTSPTGLENDSTLTLTPVAGTASGTQLPAQVAALISWHIAMRYRGGHGRTYFPYVATGAVSAPSSLSLGSQGSLLADLTTLQTDMAAISGANGGPVSPVVYRYRTNSVKAEVEAVTSFTVQPLLATQRRRLRKVPHT